MGGSSKQVTGYRYFANFLLFIGNPIEKVLGINFDKRGWQTPLIDEQKNPLSIGEVKLPNLYGENEGGVAGKIHARYGTANPQPVDFYSSYLAKNELPPLAYPYQSYLAFTGLGTPDFGGGWVGSIVGAAHGYYNDAFYLGNSGYMKEMLLWVKRIHVRNDGKPQWYDEKAEIGLARFEDKTTELRQHYLDTAGDFFTKYETNRRFSSSGQISTNSNPPFRVLGGSFGYQGGETYGSNTNQGWPIKSDGETVATYSPSYNGDFSFKIEVLSVGRTEFMQLSLGNSFFNIVDSWDIEEGGYGYFTNGYLLECFIYPNEAITIKFNTKFPSDESWSKDTHAIQILPRQPKLGIIHKGSANGTDINPIHKIREILTDDTAMNKPESDVNDINFMKAADRIWDEGLGISWSITEKSCLEAINELCGHIEAGVRVNRQTGLYEMVLFRDDWFDESEIHTIAVNKIKSMSLEVANADEAINQLNVSYYNREAIKDSSFSIAENASIRNLNGRVNAEDADFPYFMNQRNAAVVAQWKLKQMSSPVWKGTFTTAEYNARKWNRYDLLKLSWPRKWQGEITVRIMKINLGTGTDISIDFVEVVPYSSQLWSDVVIDEPIDVGVQPPIACHYEPFEMPYYLAVMALGQRQVDEELSYENNFGLVGVVAEQPQSNSLYAVMMAHNGVEGEEWVRAATINYEPAAELDQIISKTSTSFTVKNSAALSGLSIGTLIKCGSDWIGTPGEWMVFQGVDAYTGVVSVKRGALDSLPQDWGMGTKLYFCGNDVAFDSTEYVAGEKVLVSALTTTPSGVLEQKGSNSVEMKARAIRPYPSANVKINGEYWPAEIETDLILTWVDRNRVQQTGGEVIGWFEGGVTIEPNTQTHLILSQLNENNTELATTNANVTGSTSYTMPISSMQADTRFVKVTLKTVRDGYECLQPFEHIFELSQFFSAPYDLTVEFKND